MPDWKKQITLRLAKLKLNPAREKDIVDELSQHLDDRYREMRAAGKPHEEALQLALDEIDDEELLAREMRALRQSHAPATISLGSPNRGFATGIWQDVVYAARTLRKNSGFAAAAILTLALGIGANTAIFSLVNATLLRRLPLPDSERIVYLFSGQNSSFVVFSYPLYAALRDGNKSLEKLVAWGGISASLNTEEETDMVGGAIVTGHFFNALGIQALKGRLLGPADDVTPGAHPVAVISHRLWHNRFGGRDDIIGHQIRLNAQIFTIVGVTPQDFPGPQLGVMRDLYVPMMMQALLRPPRAGYSGDMNPDLLNNPNNGWLFTLGVLKPGVSKAQAESELVATLTALVQARSPRAPEQRVTLIPIDDGDPAQRRQMRSVAALLTAVVATILLIACANVANLLMSKASARRRELAVRLAVGASRFRIVRQLLTESVLLALLGGAAGILLAWGIVEAFRVAPPPAGALPVAIEFGIDGRVLLFSLSLSVLTGLVFGLIPALQAARPGLVPALKDESFLPNGHGRRITLKKIIVVAEVALSFVLLVAAGLFVRSLQTTLQIDPGISTEKLLSAPLNINLLRYTRAQGREFYRSAVERVQTIPGVEAASVARVAVLTGGGRVSTVTIEGQTPSENQSSSEGRGMRANENTVGENVVSVGFFKTLGISLVTGRDFTEQDTEDRPRVAIVSETFVRRFFPTDNPIGKRISTAFVGQAANWLEIIGIARDSKYATMNEEPQAVVYTPIRQRHETGVTLYIRASVPPATLAASVRREIQALDPHLPVPDIQTMEQTISTSLYVARMGASLLTIFSGLALLLATVGIYGVMSFAIARRTREIGIRMALGANAGRVFALVIGEGMLLVGIGVMLGLGGAFFASRTLSTFLFGVSPRDALTFATVPLVLALVAFVACCLPARRAMVVDPVAAMRES